MRCATQAGMVPGTRVWDGAYGSTSMKLTSSMRSVSLRNTGGPALVPGIALPLD